MAVCRCRTPVTCLSLGREDFIEAFGNLDEFLQAKTVSTHPTTD